GMGGGDIEEDRCNACRWSETSEGYPDAARELCDAEQDGEPSARADALAACLRIFDVGPAAADKNDGDHQAKQQQSEIGEAGKLGKHADSADIKTTPIRLKVIVSNPRVASGFNHEGYEGTRRKSSRIPPSVDRVLRGS